jgi:hypothetical protein
VDEATAILDRLALDNQPGRSSPLAARAAAVELLAADALITIACELASADCESLDARASAWSARIASHVTQLRDAESRLRR